MSEKHHSGYDGENENETKIENENENKSKNRNRNTANPTNSFNPTITFNPVINIPTPTTGEQGLLTEFNFVPLDFAGTTSESNDLNSTPLILHIDDTNDRVLLTVTVQWGSNVANFNTPAVFSILRRRQGESEFSPICSTVDSSFTGNTTLTFICVDKQPILTPGQQQVEYKVTVSTFDSINFFGNGTFTGSEIEANNSTSL